MQVKSPFVVESVSGLIKPVGEIPVVTFPEMFPVNVVPSSFKCYAASELFVRGLKVREVKVLSKVEDGGLGLIATLFKDVVAPIPVGDLLVMDFRALTLLSSFYTDKDFSLKFDVSCPHCRAKFRKTFGLDDIDYRELESKDFPIYLEGSSVPFITLYPRRVKDDLFLAVAEAKLPEWDKDILRAAIQSNWAIADASDFEMLKVQYDLIGDAPGYVWGLISDVLPKLDPGLNQMGVDCPACKERFQCEFEIDLARALR